jgi:dienelactone hydrolase
LLFDLLTEAEEAAEGYTHHVRFDIARLADRLVSTLEWVEQQQLRTLPVGVFGADTGAAAALIAGTYIRSVGAVVSLAGRPDLAAEELPKVRCPTLLIVGGNDAQVLELNRHALHQMTAPAKLQIVPGAGHLFEEAGTLDQAAHHASAWFQEHLLSVPRAQPHAQL